MEKQPNDFLLENLDSSSRTYEPRSGEELQFLWAVSYSDMLMVLMSFFVVYFSFSNKKSTSLIMQIASALNHKAHTIPVKGSGALNVAQSGQSASAFLNPALVNRLKANVKAHFFFERDAHGIASIRIDLRNNIFSPGHFKLNPEIKSDLKTLAILLRPYQNKINFTVIGDTDSAPVVGRHEWGMNSNMTLSNLRATSAAEYMIHEGINAQAIQTEGFAQYGRASRTISIRIKRSFSR